MAKKEKRPASGLPICIGFFFADSASRSNDQTVSAIRIVDTIKLTKEPPKTDDGSPSVIGLPINLVVILKKGFAPIGDCSFEIRVTAPDGAKNLFGKGVFEFNVEDEVSGPNLIAPALVPWRGPGVYWFALELHGRVAAKTPLRIRVEKKAKRPGVK